MVIQKKLESVFQRWLLEKGLISFGKNSRESIQRFIKNEALEIINLAIYDNLPKCDFEVAPADIYVFTSPLNVIAFSKNMTSRTKFFLPLEKLRHSNLNI